MAVYVEYSVKLVLMFQNSFPTGEADNKVGVLFYTVNEIFIHIELKLHIYTK